MKFVTGFVKTAQGLGAQIGANIKKMVGTSTPPPRPPIPAPGSNMATAFGSIRKAFGGS